jgi:hypothetical protein
MIRARTLAHVSGGWWGCRRPRTAQCFIFTGLGKRESLSAILTVDRADFVTYRIKGKRQFRVLPASRP